jgi:hypothetical protein
MRALRGALCFARDKAALSSNGVLNGSRSWKGASLCIFEIPTGTGQLFPSNGGKEMRTRTRMIVMGLVMVTMLLLATGSAAARTTKTDVEVVDYGCHLVDPGVSWVDEEGILHIKGQMYNGETRSSDARFIGASTLYVVSWNINLATGDYTLHAIGTLDLEDPSIDGTWEFLSINSRNVGGVIAARAVARGTGDLAGLKARMIVETLNEPPDPTVCEESPQYVSRWIVTVLDPHGE